MKIVVLLALIAIGSCISPLSPGTINYLQGYAYGVGMSDKVPEIMDCIIDVILINPEIKIMKQEFQSKGALNIWNGVVDIFYTFDKFAQECGNTFIGLNKMQKTMRSVLKTPHLFKFVINNLSQESEKITKIMEAFSEAVQDKDTYQSGFQIGQFVKVAFQL